MEKSRKLQNAPSTTGNPSGSGRGNNPPKSTPQQKATATPVARRGSKT